MQVTLNRIKEPTKSKKKYSYPYKNEQIRIPHNCTWKIGWNSTAKLVYSEFLGSIEKIPYICNSWHVYREYFKLLIVKTLK